MASNSGYNAYNPNNGAIAGDIGTDIRHLGPGMLSMDVVGTYERDAVNIAAMYPAQALNANGTPTTFPADAAAQGNALQPGHRLRAGKYSFGSWGPEQPLVAKAPAAPPPVFPLTLYAGYSGFSSPAQRPADHVNHR